MRYDVEDIYPLVYTILSIYAPARAAEPPHNARKKAKIVGRPPAVVIKAFELP